MKLTTAQLDKIEQTAKKATPGPWAVQYGDPMMSGRRWTLRRERTPGIIVSAHEYGGHWISEHIASMDPATTLALVAEVRELRTAIERVRAIHMKSPRRSECLTCVDENEDLASWPCDTIKALGDAS